MNENLKWLDVVMLAGDLPEYGLNCGQVGTIVEVIGPNSFEVEFLDKDGLIHNFLCLRESRTRYYCHQNQAKKKKKDCCLLEHVCLPLS
jgi:hypothetical protein